MTEYQKLKEIIQEAERLLKQDITSSDAGFQAWKTKAARFLIKKYGEKSFEYQKFERTYFTLSIYTFNTPRSDFVAACRYGLKESIAVFNTYLEELKTEMAPIATSFNMQKLFIVHGHDGELKESVARLVVKQGIEVIILSNKANQGKTIIEKIEKYSDVGGAICLFTADDLGREKNESELKVRARQNVVFEAGYFMGKLGRDHIAIIAENGMEMPSDLSGVVYTNKSNWELDLLRELKAMGYSIDYNKLD